MFEWLVWLLFSLLPAIFTIIGDLELQVMVVLYFIAVAGAVIFWRVRDRMRAKRPDTI
ncbi:hypothetical protein KAH81_05025 [bacterium]|nr:hypothetical protein [bacterium]